MKRLLVVIPMLLLSLAPVHAAITLAVSQQSGATVQERAGQLAGQIGRELGTRVEVVALADASQVDLWLNRYATAEMALVETSHTAGKPGQFVIIGPVGRDLVLIGRQGISGDLPLRISGLLGGEGGRSVSPTAGDVPRPPAAQRTPARAAQAPVAATDSGVVKSIEEDRFFVRYIYRERLNRDPDADHLEFWTEQLQSGAVTKQQLYEMTCDLEKKSCGIR